MVLYVPSAKGMQGFATYPLSHVIVFPERFKCCKAKKKKRKEKEKDSLPGRVRAVCWVGGRIFPRRGARIAERGVGTSVAAATERSTLSINSPVASHGFRSIARDCPQVAPAEDSVEPMERSVHASCITWSHAWPAGAALSESREGSPPANGSVEAARADEGG